jgi:hypothetical protein
MLVQQDERLLMTGSERGLLSVWRLGEGTPPVLGCRGSTGTSPIVDACFGRNDTSVIVCDGGEWCGGGVLVVC